MRLATCTQNVFTRYLDPSFSPQGLPWRGPESGPLPATPCAPCRLQRAWAGRKARQTVKQGSVTNFEEAANCGLLNFNFWVVCVAFQPGPWCNMPVAVRGTRDAYSSLGGLTQKLCHVRLPNGGPSKKESKTIVCETSCCDSIPRLGALTGGELTSQLLSQKMAGRVKTWAAGVAL